MSSEDEEIENPIKTAVSRGASPVELEKASISRKRKVIVNSGQYKANREHKNPNSKTSVWSLECVRGQLRCNACQETLAQKKSTVAKHVKSKKHLNGILSIAKSKKDSQTILKSLQKQDNRDHASGSTLPSDTRLFRYEVVETPLLAGIPISKVDILRPLFKRYAKRLTSSSHMNSLILAVLEKEKEKLKAELHNVKKASIIFDGTAQLGEALAIVLRFVREDCKPTQHLVRLEVLAKPLKGNESAQKLMTCIAINHNFGPNMVLAGMRDGATVKSAAIKQLLFFSLNIKDVICFSHTINNVECHFVFRVLDTFFRHWVNLFAHSYNAKLLCKERTTKSMCFHSNIRWWSKWELLKQVSDYFGDVAPFLQDNENLSPLIRQRLLEIVNDPEDLQDLRLELGLMVDVGVHFVNATYYLEGDRPLIFTGFERLSTVLHAVAVGHYPSTLAIATEIANGDAALQNWLITQAKDCVQPGLNYFQQKFNV